MAAVELEALVKRVATAQKVDTQNGAVTVKLTVTLEAEIAGGDDVAAELVGLQHKLVPHKVKIGG